MIELHKLIKPFFGRAKSQNNHENLKKKRRKEFDVTDTKLTLKLRNINNVKKKKKYKQCGADTEIDKQIPETRTE